VTGGRTYIAVCGPDPAPDEVAAQCESVGRAIAEAGAVLVCGGLGGAMEAASRGAATGGGTVLGILPGGDRGAANEFVGVAVPTGMGEMRNALIVRAADAVIAIGGGAGTLSEIGFACKLEKAVFGLRTFEVKVEGVDAGFIKAVDTPEGVDSLELLAEAYRRVRAAGFELVNADCILVGEEPRIASRRDEMRARLAQALGTGPETVNVRATTTDRLGFTGRGEGLAAQAVALLRRAT